ncbi:MAG: tetratricopeptide repeat protein [Vicinamibacterales bacterium]
MATGDYERAHDLAWRAVQRGPRNDAALMYLLARAQSLSGRPDDALVMLRRLVEMGVAVDASTADFRRVRDLPGWSAFARELSGELRRDKPAAPATEAVVVSLPSEAGIPEAKPTVVAPQPSVRMNRPFNTAPGAPSAAALAALAALAAPAAPAAPEDPIEPVIVDTAGHFSSPDFAPGGLACDGVSRRFVFGDRPGRKLRVVTDGGDSSIDLTRGESAGFLDVMALDVDTTRGDLWVVSAEADGGSATLHRLQLVSGRVLNGYQAPAAFAAVRPVDLAVTASGAVVILDAARPRLLVLRAGAPALEVLADLQDEAPVSVAAGSRDGVVYVAHRNGLSRVDLRTRSVTPLGAPARMFLGGIDRLRRHAAELIGMQAMADGSRRLVRLALDAAGTAVTRLRVVGVPLPPAGTPALAAFCGDTLAILTGEKAGTAPTEWTLLRIRLAP